MDFIQQTGDNQLSGWAEKKLQSTSQTQTHTKKRLWSLVVVCFQSDWTSLMAQMVKRLPTMQETWVQFLGQEKSPGEGNGNLLQYSCLKNPEDGGAW